MDKNTQQTMTTQSSSAPELTDADLPTRLRMAAGYIAAMFPMNAQGAAECEEAATRIDDLTAALARVTEERDAAYERAAMVCEDLAPEFLKYWKSDAACAACDDLAKAIRALKRGAANGER